MTIKSEHFPPSQTVSRYMAPEIAMLDIRLETQFMAASTATGVTNPKMGEDDDNWF